MYTHFIVFRIVVAAALIGYVGGLYMSNKAWKEESVTSGHARVIEGEWEWEWECPYVQSHKEIP